MKGTPYFDPKLLDESKDYYSEIPEEDAVVDATQPRSFTHSLIQSAATMLSLGKSTKEEK